MKKSINEPDSLFDMIRKFVIETETTSTTAIQRKFGLSFNRVACIMERLEMDGIISEPLKLGKRELLITKN